MGIKENFYKKSIGDSKKVELDGETIYLKKTGFVTKDWQKINPPVEEKDGQIKWNYFNLFFGGKKNLIRLILIFLLLSVAYYEISRLIGDAKDWMDGANAMKRARNEFISEKLTYFVNAISEMRGRGEDPSNLISMESD